jgi:hypothetical protein
MIALTKEKKKDEIGPKQINISNLDEEDCPNGNIPLNNGDSSEEKPSSTNNSSHQTDKTTINHDLEILNFLRNAFPRLISILDTVLLLL